ncbi:hypothetical protein NESM_000850800 [Novymonas esmeraldas]|uniref:Uncharacterized protein n=1 Tax=Novymonas esmeraldas TaxID=1808958 RepID=A0AAW0EZA5_9TRYP
MSVRVAARPWAAVCRGALVHHRRHISGGGRGDLFVRHASAYRTSLYGVRRGLTDSSQATDHHSGQLHARKRVEHTIGDRASSGNGLHRAAIAAWSYLLPSLRQSVETALPITVFDKLRTGEAPLTPSEAQQLTDAQRILRFELRQRIALLEDSLAEAELPYLLQWPMLFERAWIRLPVGACHAPPPPTQTAQSSSVDSSALSTAATPAPHSVAQWASSARPTAAPSNDGGGRLVPRVSQLTQHVMRAVEEDLRLLKSGAVPRDDGAPRSRRQAALEASWRTQWAASLQWHAGVQ